MCLFLRYKMLNVLRYVKLEVDFHNKIQTSIKAFTFSLSTLTIDFYRYMISVEVESVWKFMFLFIVSVQNISNLKKI